MVCDAHCGRALRERTLHSRRVLEPGVLLLCQMLVGVFQPFFGTFRIINSVAHRAAVL
jgi:hypothetical protein